LQQALKLLDWDLSDYRQNVFGLEEEGQQQKGLTKEQVQSSQSISNPSEILTWGALWKQYISIGSRLLDGYLRDRKFEAEVALLDQNRDEIRRDGDGEFPRRSTSAKSDRSTSPASSSQQSSVQNSRRNSRRSSKNTVPSHQPDQHSAQRGSSQPLSSGTQNKNSTSSSKSPATGGGFPRASPPLNSSSTLSSPLRSVLKSSNSLKQLGSPPELDLQRNMNSSHTEFINSHRSSQLGAENSPRRIDGVSSPTVQSSSNLTSPRSISSPSSTLPAGSSPAVNVRTLVRSDSEELFDEKVDPSERMHAVDVDDGDDEVMQNDEFTHDPHAVLRAVTNLSEKAATLKAGGFQHQTSSPSSRSVVVPTFGFKDLTFLQQFTFSLQLFVLYFFFPLLLLSALHNVCLPFIALIWALIQASSSASTSFSSSFPLALLPTMLCLAFVLCTLPLLALLPRVVNFHQHAAHVRMFGFDLDAPTADRLILYHRQLAEFESLVPVLEDVGFSHDIAIIILQVCLFLFEFRLD
jgi:hypothetical protein